MVLVRVDHEVFMEQLVSIKNIEMSTSKLGG